MLLQISIVILQSSSYAVFDSGYKYQYDRWNNEYRWMPTNADVAGLMAKHQLTPSLGSHLLVLPEDH